MCLYLKRRKIESHTRKENTYLLQDQIHTESSGNSAKCPLLIFLRLSIIHSKSKGLAPTFHRSSVSLPLFSHHMASLFFSFPSSQKACHSVSSGNSFARLRRIWCQTSCHENKERIWQPSTTFFLKLIGTHLPSQGTSSC